jgi:PKHD-type hydroxylase
MAYMFESDRVEDWAFIDNVFTEEECKKIIEYGNSKDKIKGGIIYDMTRRDTQVREEYRKVNVARMLVDKDNLWIYDKISDALHYANEKYFNLHVTGFTEDLQFAEYNEGDFFVTHVDKTFNRTIRKLSCTMMLNTEYEGGDLVIETQGTTATTEKQVGRMIVFPSYIPHKITKVTSGTRYSIFGWATGNPFK